MCKQLLTRRSVVQAGAGLLTFSAMPAVGQTPAAVEEPHFFLHILIPGGFDCSYSFDARSLAMTSAKLQTNYSEREPEKYVGLNGGEAWITASVAPLRPHLDRLSLINGVLMLTSFDGHTENQSYMLTGYPFGGESYVPNLNLAGRFPIDAVAVNDKLGVNLTNAGNTIPLSPKIMASLLTRLDKLPDMRDSNPFIAAVRQRFVANAAKNRKFGMASEQIAATMPRSSQLAESMKKLPIAPVSTDADPIADHAKLIGDVFTAKIAGSAVYVIRPPLSNIDAHSFDDARVYPATAAALAQDLATVFNYFRQTSYDKKRSLLDVTTILISSEMSRTMRSDTTVAFERSGTDHNPYRNSILVGGKHIKGGLVLGASDFHTPTEQLSPVHLRFDPSKNRVIGRPFDFATMQSRADLPSEYRPADYLSYASVVNTLFKAFAAAPSRYWALDRAGTTAATLDALLGMG